MDMNDLILVSVDDHVVEPPDMCERHVSKADLERAPRVIHIDEMDADVWVFEGTDHPQRRPQRGRRPSARGVRHRAHRVRRDAQGLLRHPRARPRHERQRRARLAVLPVDARLLRTVVRPHARPATSGSRLLQGYNDWHIDEWCGTYPGRFIPLAIVPIWDAELMAAEIYRVAEKGCRAVTFSENPSKLGLPELPLRPLGPVLARVRGDGHRRVPAHRLVVVDLGDVRRRAGRRDDHAPRR